MCASLPVCVHACVFVLVCVPVCLSVCMCVSICGARLCVRVCMCVCLPVCACVSICGVCTCVRLCVRVWTHFMCTLCGCMCTRVCPRVHVCAYVPMLEHGSTQQRALSPSGEAVKCLCSHRCPVLEARGPGGVLRLVTTCPRFRAPAPHYLVPMKRATGGKGSPYFSFLGIKQGMGRE